MKVEQVVPLTHAPHAFAEMGRANQLHDLLVCAPFDQAQISDVGEGPALVHRRHTVRRWPYQLFRTATVSRHLVTDVAARTQCSCGDQQRADSNAPCQ